jgi:hypothetical protein
MVEVMWTHDHHNDDELDFPNEERDMTLGQALSTHVLWNKADIVLDLSKSASKPSQPLLSPPGGPSDDDDNGSDGNDDDGSHGSTLPRSPHLDTSNPQGGTGGDLGHQTPPLSLSKGKCPPVPKKPEEEGDKPAQLTDVEWAMWNVAKEYQYTMVFKRYIC